MNDPSAEQIRARHDALLDRLRAISEASGHDPARLRIVAVTKAHPIAVAHRAMEAGLTRLGESRVQEAEPKVAALPDIEWHFIGRLQSNKARRVIRSFAAIHSVDSVDLLQRLDRLAAEENRRPRVLLQVNVAAEASKAGLAPEGLTGIEAPTNLDLVGLMTIAPMGASEQEARAVFRRLRELRDRLQEAAGIGLPELSMGMSADAEAAAAEGATLVRIGTALFGHRH
jgi:pyridoxal phosphate enzyme (YggS family)